jgi:hypothetical protein
MRTSTPRIRIHFVIDPLATHWPDLERLTEPDIDAMPERFVGGRNSWIAQTFLRLRPALEARGWEVTTGPGFVPGTLAIVHRDDANRFDAAAAASFLVVVRADRAPVRACDVAIAQNALDLEGNERFLPLWPQPGLRPRDAGRGARLECLAYQGRVDSAPGWFKDGDFHRALRRRGVRFEVRSRGWSDYTTVDAALAVRDESARVLSTKPATKLYNGWLAGVPVLAAPEPAYRALRRGPLDLLEVTGPREVLAAVDALQAQPGLYRDMVRNGRERGAAFDVEATRQRWLDLLDREIVPRYVAMRGHLGTRGGWFGRALACQRVASRWHKWVVAMQRADRGGAGVSSSPKIVVEPGFFPVK